MVIYSEILDKKFDTVDECLKAEHEHERKLEEEAKAKKVHEAELDKAFEEAIAACDRYLRLAGVDIATNIDDDGFEISYKTNKENDEIFDLILKLFEDDRLF